MIQIPSSAWRRDTVFVHLHYTHNSFVTGLIGFDRLVEHRQIDIGTQHRHTPTESIETSSSISRSI